MRRFVPATVVGSVLLVAASSAMALGMGRVRTSSFLGDPLDLSVALSAEPADALAVECIRAEVHAGDSRVPDEMIRLRLNRRSDGAPDSLRLVTGMRIDEPIARVDLTLNCGTLLTRRYVVFVDPPVLDLAAAAASGEMPGAVARPVLRRDEPATQARPRRDRAAAERPLRRTAGSAPASSGSTVAASRAPRDPPRRTARADRTAATARSEPGSRLQLESAAAPAAAPVERPVGVGEAALAVPAGAALVAAATPGAGGRCRRRRRRRRRRVGGGRRTAR